ncbi:MAG TPA: MATE family efflux transporter [Candidatus Protoclostridium stercorigallinarum]|uniref:Multidrug export protein MepA n=1 Tax=Candidatus Protoclostridium stercorigallinarum TaxID=2838741 RepID=A0A9D1TRU4_9FIRM|nr:MATE family efflux transporter [Candidatus Protoclostridium stercorigallinarum]
MKDEVKKEKRLPDLGRDPVGKLVAKLAVPAIAAQLINLLYNMVDRMYVAALPGEGTQALAALGVVFPITLIVTAFGYLVGLGGAPIANMRMGEGKRDEANRVFCNAFLMLAFFGAALTVVVLTAGDALLVLFGAPDDCMEQASGYLFVYGTGTLFVMFVVGLNPYITAQGRSVMSMLTVLLGAVLNIALDPLFIYAFGMGVSGAAVATVISQAASAVWALSFFFRKNSLFRFRIGDMRPHIKIMLGVLALGLSPFIMTATESAVQIVFNINLKWSTGGSSDYTAALTVMMSALQMVSMPLNGLGTGVQPLVSYNYGAGNTERVKRAVKIITIAALIGSTSVWLLSVLFPQLYAFIFNASEPVTALVKKYTPFFMMGTIMFFAQMTLQNTFVALGQAKISISLACLRKIVLLIPLCFILPNFLGAFGVFLSEGIADITAGIITAAAFFIRFPRLLDKREKRIN